MKWEEKNDMNMLIKTHGEVLDRIELVESGLNHTVLWYDKKTEELL